jgi:hypothetical protein
MQNPFSTTDLHRQSTFGFSCSRCLACCRYKKIQLNPYEVARLAANQGLSTTEFIARYTITGGTVLRFNQEGTCVFLNDRGCAVHPDRPLVCRLYPLGRYVDFLGVETFAQIEPEPGCKGIGREDSIIERYLEEQDAAPFMRAADRYLDLLWLLLELLKEQEVGPAQAETVLSTVRAVTEDGGEQNVSWIDMDRALADYCKLSGIPVPVELDQKMALHIKAGREWAA